MVNCYITSALIISLIIIIFRQELDGWIGTYRYTIKFYNQVYIDPNFLAAFINIPAILVVNRLFITNRNKLRILYFVITAIIMFGVLLTGSRASLIAMLLGCAIVASSYLEIRKYILLVIIFLSLGITMYFLLPEALIHRFFTNSYNDNSNIRRVLAWKFGLDAFYQKPLFGYGIVNSATILNNLYSYNVAIHNTYIQLIVQLGITGTIPFFLIILNSIIYILKNNLRVLLGIVLSLLFTSFMIEQNITITFWTVLIMLNLAISFKKDNPKVDLAKIL
ncbi:O-antigen ligase family protein [Paenibacillus sp. 7028]|nr:O-antigen ligase family protein [Paenibacillus apii]